MDPTFELIRKCMEILRADAGISGFVGTRIYDRVPEDQDGNVTALSPYIAIQNANLTSEGDFDCLDIASVNISFSCYSWGDGEAYSSAQVRKLSNAVRKALNRKEIDLGVNGLVDIQHLITNYNRASDGVTWQAVVVFEVFIDIIESEEIIS